jgi:Zn-dependent protease with chaperone function
MSTLPDRSRVRLPDISSRAYEHPADRSALVTLRKLTGFDVIFRALASLFSDKSFRLTYLASSVRASEQQFPDLYQMLLDGCYVLDMPRVPELFIVQDPTVNAKALGTDKPFIVLHTAIVDLMDAEEIRWVIGHELGHVLSGHSLYNTMLDHLQRLALRLAFFPLAWLGLKAVFWGLEEWHRKAEVSGDRAGLLAGQNVAAARRALMKMAGGPQLAELSADAFLEQAREYDAVPDLRESLIKLLQMQGETHPFAVVRFADLDRWAREGEYESILAGNYPRRSEDSGTSVGDEFKSAAKSYQDSWSRSADPLIGAVRGVAGSAVGAGERLMNRFGGRRDDTGTDSGEDS